LTSVAIVLILFSAIIHGFWNYVGKSQASNTYSFLIANIIGSLILLPILVYYHSELFVIKHIWKYILLTGCFNGIYYWALSTAYKYGDLSFVYPLRNALPIVMVTSFSFAIGKGDKISNIALVGFILIVFGCLILPITNIKKVSMKKYINKAVFFAVIAAIGTAGYSIIDSYALEGIRQVSDGFFNKTSSAIFYSPILAIISSFTLLPFLIIDKIVFKFDFRKEKVDYKSAAYVGIGIYLAYFLVLIAYGYVTDVSYISTFRQVSIPLTVISGVLLLKEKLNFGKIYGSSLIIIGLILTALY